MEELKIKERKMGSQEWAKPTGKKVCWAELAESKVWSGVAENDLFRRRTQA